MEASSSSDKNLNLNQTGTCKATVDYNEADQALKGRIAEAHGISTNLFSFHKQFFKVVEHLAEIIQAM